MKIVSSKIVDIHNEANRITTKSTRKKFSFLRGRVSDSFRNITRTVRLDLHKKIKK